MENNLGTILVVIASDLIQSFVLVLFARSLIHYLRKFKGEKDSFTVATMIFLGAGILCKIVVSLPLRCIALFENLDTFDDTFNDDDKYSPETSYILKLLERSSILFTSTCIDIATLCNLTRWALIVLGL